MLKPHVLRSGDRLAIVAPASHFDRAEFDAMLSRFYAISALDESGVPKAAWREELERVLG